MFKKDINLFKELYKKDEVTEDILDRVEQILTEASDIYYNSDKKIMTDVEFDELLKLYEEYRDFKVGAEPPSGKKLVEVEHSFGHLVGGLNKVNTLEELNEWLHNTAKHNVYEVMVSPKYDGNSIAIEYINGKVVKALTRGRNGKGVDLTSVFKNHTIKDTDHVGIKYEVIMTYSDFDKIVEKDGETYANPRSLVAGKLGSDNAHEYSEFFTLVPLAMSYKDKDISKKEEFEFLKRNFDDTFVKNIHFFKGTHQEVMKKITKVYEDTIKSRETLDYMLDGIVIEFAEPSYKSLGIVNSKPKWAVALKFPYMEKESTVIDIEFDYGDTGRITPCVVFEPVEFNGAIQRRVSLANYKRFNELKLGVGSKILVQYRNEVLSYVEKLDDPINDTIEPIPFINKCPVCNGKIVLNKNRTFAFCGNPDCDGKSVGKILRYLKTLDIKGIRESTVKKLYDAGLLRSIPDLYTMDYSKIPSVEGLGQKTADLIKNAMHSRKVYDYEILAGIGIQDFGIASAKILCSKLNLYEIMTRYEQRSFLDFLLELEGFSHIMVSKVREGLSENHNLIVDLYEITNPIEYKEVLKQNASEETYTFVVTGSVNHWKNRKELTNFLESKGHKVTGSVTKKTDYLINNDVDSTSSKNKKAKELGIPIISEEQLKELLGI